MRSLGYTLTLALLVLVSSSPAGEYRDIEGGFAFITPNIGSPLAGQAVQRFTLMGPTVDNFAPNMKVQIKQIQTTREAMVEQSDKDFVTSQMTVKAKNLREVNGFPAVSYECEWTYQNMPLRMINLVIIEPDRMVVATCTAPAAAFPTYEAEFRKAIDSFTLTQR